MAFVRTFLKIYNHLCNSLPATDKRLQQIQAVQKEDPTCIKHCMKGWPSKQKLKGEISKYLHTASELSICEGLILCNSRIVIPKALQNDILQKLHSGHQGINKCKRRAAQSVWWPGLNKNLETMVSNCSTCCKMQLLHDVRQWSTISANTFSSFAKEYGFTHYMSSPRYPQANGEVERGIRTVKILLKKAEENSEDPYLALLAHRNTPASCGYSLAQLTMCRILRSTLPSTIEQLKPKLPDMTVFQEQEKKR